MSMTAFNYKNGSLDKANYIKVILLLTTTSFANIIREQM